MLSSMTGFARAQAQTEFGLIVCELRSLNHRYLDIHLKLPEGCKEWESDCRDKIQQKLARGKLECVVQLIPNSQFSPNLSLNMGLIDQLIIVSQHISDRVQKITKVPSVNALKVKDFLRWPGVISQEHMPAQQLKVPVLLALEAALSQLTTVRQNEGEKLLKFLAEKLEICIEKLSKIKIVLPEILALKRQKLTEKLANLKQELDAHRLEQELIYFAQRLDVMEEVERFEVHLQELNTILNEPKCLAEGRRLDFLMQEMQREINTLNNKALSSQIAKSSVDLKVIIEQMREQIQNIE